MNNNAPTVNRLANTWVIDAPIPACPCFIELEPIKPVVTSHWSKASVEEFDKLFNPALTNVLLFPAIVK